MVRRQCETAGHAYVPEGWPAVRFNRTPRRVQKDLLMLVLSRKPGERILIGTDIVVTVVRIGPNTVRLGIDAPAHMNIVREELLPAGQLPPATKASA